jgi:hypothetical protein
MLPLESSPRRRLRGFSRSAGAALPPLSLSLSVKALFASPVPSAAELPVGNRPRIALVGQVPLTNAAVFHRVALER